MILPVNFALVLEGQTVGGQARVGTLPLRDGDVIIVAASLSPYVFKFWVS